MSRSAKQEDKKYNYAHRASAKERFTDDKKEESKVKLSSGSYIDVTYYSDGSSTHHFGGPCGSTDYDENGEEC